MRTNLILRTLLIAVVALGAAQASVIYDFSGIGNPSGVALPVAFQVTLPDFINLPVGGPTFNLPCSVLQTSLNCDTTQPFAVVFSVVQIGLGNGYVDSLQFQASNNSGYWFYFKQGSFTVPGVYLARSDNPLFNTGALTVTAQADQAAAPEPSGAVMAGLGLALVAVARRRLAS